MRGRMSPRARQLPARQPASRSPDSNLASPGESAARAAFVLARWTPMPMGRPNQLLVARLPCVHGRNSTEEGQHIGNEGSCNQHIRSYESGRPSERLLSAAAAAASSSSTFAFALSWCHGVCLSVVSAPSVRSSPPVLISLPRLSFLVSYRSRSPIDRFPTILRRLQAKQNNAKQMNTAGRQSRQTVTANRQSSARDQKLTKLRGQQPVASQQPMLVYYDANGQQVLQPVAVIQQPGQAGAQVIPTGTATKGPMFKAANRQPNQQQAAGGARRQSASGNQRQAAARGGRGGRRN